MFETKLARSVQRDYRQAADNHRLGKVADNRSRRSSIATVLTVAAPIFFLLAFIY